jgi:hypothetical protein
MTQTAFLPIHCRSDVQQGKLILLVDDPAVVIVNNVPNLFAASVNNPVVPVKWQLIT